MKRSQMTSTERDFRARLAKMVHWKEFLRGTLCVRKGMCGKEGCKCLQGEKHLHFVLERNDKGKRRQLYIPKKWEKEVRQWLKEYRTITDLLERVSRLQWRKLEERKKQGG